MKAIIDIVAGETHTSVWVFTKFGWVASLVDCETTPLCVQNTFPLTGEASNI